MIDYYTPFYINQFYHIYNRGNNGEKIIFSYENYRFFLKRFDQHLSGIAETFAYCILPNHFHFLIKVIDKDKVSVNFKNFFISYSKSINKQEGRTGSLFQKRFKRTIIENSSSLLRVILYIHSNPLHHNIRKDFTNYPYSSYRSILSEKNTKLCREEVLKMFNGKNNFVKLHQERIERFHSEKFYIEK